MKKIAITVLLISLAGMALFAEGSQEEQTWEPGMGRGYISEDQTNFVPGSMGRASMRGGNFAGNQSTWGPSGLVYNNQSFNEESMTLTGKIDLTDANLPKLTVGDDTYELMVPYRLDYDIDINDGDEITISGFEIPAYRRTSDSDLTSLMVTDATFDGTEYNLDMMNNGPVGYGPGSNMMNNYGPANGYHGKPGRYNNSYPNNFRNRGPQPNSMMHRPYGRR